MYFKVFYTAIILWQLSTPSYGINFKLLELEADTYNHRICIGIPSNKEMVKKSLIFINDKEDIEKKYYNIENFKEFYRNVTLKITNEHYIGFSNECFTIFNESSERHKAAVYLLLERVHKKFSQFLKLSDKLKNTTYQINNEEKFYFFNVKNNSQSILDTRFFEEKNLFYSENKKSEVTKNFSSITQNNSNFDEEISDLTSTFSNLTTSNTGYFVRSKNNEIITRYAEKIKYNGKEIVVTPYQEAENYLQELSQIAENDDWKNHMIASPFISFEPITIRHFMKKENKIIDWASSQSKIKNEKYPNYHIIKHKTGSGHSEEQFIEEMNEIMRTKPENISNIFFSSTEFLSFHNTSPKVLFCGFELLRAFDNCDTCLGYLDDFIRPGQKSLKNFLLNEIQKKRWEISTNFEHKDFPLCMLSQSYYPYKKASYSVEYEGKSHDYKYRYQNFKERLDSFKPKNIDSSTSKIEKLNQLPEFNIQENTLSIPILSKIYILNSTKIDQNKQNNEITISQSKKKKDENK